MNTHPHSDHTGGLPALVAEGATIITQKNNEAFFDKALNTPRTLLNDTLAKNPKKAKVEAVAEEGLLGWHADRRDAPHLPGASLEWPDGQYIPKEKVLFQAIAACSRAAGQRSCQSPSPALEKLKLVDFDRYINVHTSAAPQTKAELWKAAGK